MAELKPFEDVVEFRESGQIHQMIVLAVKPGGLIDGLFAKRLFAGDGKTPVNVIGSSRQAEMVQFRHDIAPGQYRATADWFFSLDDDEIEALLKERDRRRHEKAQAAEAEAHKAATAKLLDGVAIAPSEAVLAKAMEIWKAALIESGHLDQHSDIVFPPYQAAQAKWQPWIEKAKEVLAAEGGTAKGSTAEAAVPQAASGSADPSPGDGGLVN